MGDKFLCVFLLTLCATVALSQYDDSYEVSEDRDYSEGDFNDIKREDNEFEELLKKINNGEERLFAPAAERNDNDDEMPSNDIAFEAQEHAGLERENKDYDVGDDNMNGNAEVNEFDPDEYDENNGPNVGNDYEDEQNEMLKSPYNNPLEVDWSKFKNIESEHNYDKIEQEAQNNVDEINDVNEESYDKDEQIEGSEEGEQEVVQNEDIIEHNKKDDVDLDYQYGDVDEEENGDIINYENGQDIQDVQSKYNEEFVDRLNELQQSENENELKDENDIENIGKPEDSEDVDEISRDEQKVSDENNSRNGAVDLQENGENDNVIAESDSDEEFSIGQVDPVEVPENIAEETQNNLNEDYEDDEENLANVLSSFNILFNQINLEDYFKDDSENELEEVNPDNQNEDQNEMSREESMVIDNDDNEIESPQEQQNLRENEEGNNEQNQFDETEENDEEEKEQDLYSDANDSLEELPFERKENVNEFENDKDNSDTDNFQEDENNEGDVPVHEELNVHQVDPLNDDLPAFEMDANDNIFESANNEKIINEFIESEIQPISYTLSLESAVTVTSPDYPEPYKNSGIIDWYFSGENGTGIELNITSLDIDGNSGDYLLIKPGQKDATGPDGLVFTHSLTQERRYRFTDVDVMYVRFEVKGENLQNYKGFEFSVKFIAPKTEREIEPEPIPEATAQLPEETLTVYLTGFYQRQESNTTEEFRRILVDMAAMYVAREGIDAGEISLDDAVQLLYVSACNINWPSSDSCAAVTFGIPLSSSSAEYTLSSEQLAEMWFDYSRVDPFAIRLRMLGISEYAAPNDRAVIYKWALASSLVLFLVWGIGWIAFRSNCLGDYKGMKRLEEDAESVASGRKSNLSLYPTPHQNLPPMFAEDKYDSYLDGDYTPDNDTTRVDMGGAFSNKSFVRDGELMDLDSDEEIVMSLPDDGKKGQSFNSSIRPRDVYDV